LKAVFGKVIKFVYLFNHCQIQAPLVFRKQSNSSLASNGTLKKGQKGGISKKLEIIQGGKAGNLQRENRRAKH